MSKLMFKALFRKQKAILPTLMWGGLRAKLFSIAAMLLFLILSGTIISVIAFDFSFGEAFWWAWTHVLDPGFLSDDTSRWSRKILGSLFSISGIVILGGAFITLAEEAARRTFENMKKGRIPSNLKGHTIIAGTGPKLNRFIETLKSLPEAPLDEKMVVVVPDPALIDATREICGSHIRIMVGHIWEVETRKRLNLAKARRIVILDNFGGDNGNMLDTLFSLKDLRIEPVGTANDDLFELKIYAEVNDQALHAALRSFITHLRGAEAKMEVNVLNMADASARLAIRDHPLDCEVCSSDQEGRMVLIILGWSPFANALFWQALRIAHYPSKPTRIIVAHPSADELKKQILSTAPGIFDNQYAKDIMSVEFTEFFSPAGRGLTEQHLVTVAVCGASADEVFAKSLQLSESPFFGLKQILLDLPDGSGYRPILEKMKEQIPIPFHAAGSHAEAFELAEKLDETARAIHERYIVQREQQGKRRLENDRTYKDKSDYDWEQLDEVRRGWNRAAADHIEVKLRALADFHGIQRPVRNGSSGIPTIDPGLRSKIKEMIAHVDQKNTTIRDDLEILARLEHDRWSAEKIAQGWVFGERRDAEKKISPYLTLYEKLTEEVKQYDREVIAKVFENDMCCLKDSNR